jgi:hypothetical protein
MHSHRNDRPPMTAHRFFTHGSTVVHAAYFGLVFLVVRNTVIMQAPHAARIALLVLMYMSSLLAEHVAYRYASTWKQTTLEVMARERYIPMSPAAGLKTSVRLFFQRSPTRSSERVRHIPNDCRIQNASRSVLEL